MDNQWIERVRPSDQRRQSERYPFIKEVRYQRSVLPNSGILEQREQERVRLGIMLNIGQGGLCLLVERSLNLGEIVRILMPASLTEIPTLAQVCWDEALPLRTMNLLLTGLKFVL